MIDYAEKGSRSAKIEGVPVHIDNDFDLMRRGSLGRVCERMRGGHDVDLVIGSEEVHHAVEQRWFGQRLIPLHINNDLILPRCANDLGYPVGSALMAWRGHRHFGAPIKSCPRDAHVVGRDDNGVQFLCLSATHPYTLKKRLTGNQIQWFFWKTRRSPACRNNCHCLTHFSCSR